MQHGGPCMSNVFPVNQKVIWNCYISLRPYRYEAMAESKIRWRKLRNHLISSALKLSFLCSPIFATKNVLLSHKSKRTFSTVIWHHIFFQKHRLWNLATVTALFTVRSWPWYTISCWKWVSRMSILCATGTCWAAPGSMQVDILKKMLLFYGIWVKNN